MSELSIEIENLLRETAKKLKISKFEIKFANSAIRGEGFIGEFFLASIINKSTNEIIEVAIKKAFKNEQKRNELKAKIAYEVEIDFYSKIFPTLNNFQIQKIIKEPFNQIAKYYYGSLEEFCEALVLENLKADGYNIRDVKELLDEEHYGMIFETYGKFHGLSMAFKDQHFEKYKKLIDTKDYMLIVLNCDSCVTLMQGVIKEAFSYFDTNSELYEKCLKYINNTNEELNKVATYKGNHTVITHGDCWSNNIMYKYSKNGKLENLKLIDFQLVRESNPVHDLSYVFYSSGNKAVFDNLDKFLQIYYESFSKTLRDLGSNPVKLFTFKQLQEDWKSYSRFGVIMALGICKIKLLNTNDLQVIVKDHNDDSLMLESILNARVNPDEFRKRSKEIIMHAFEMNAL